MSAGTYRLEDGAPQALLRKHDDFGLEVLDLARPPERFWADGALPPPPSLRLNVDGRRARSVPHPAELLAALPPGENWQSMSRRSLGALEAWFLLAEDPQRRLEAKSVETLAHQASLVQHVLGDPSLARVLIADEVGLGKTVEAGLIIRRLLEGRPGLRVLYLAPARLVTNVMGELDRLELGFRAWMSGGEATATWRDPRIVASIHRAVHPAHVKAVLAAPPWDLIIVDECHHRSDWARGGGNPVLKYKLVDQLRERLTPGGRFILMSGTPHQGHPDRFTNLVQLLRDGSEEASAVAGRVIYRTKDDVRDWEGRPLFPSRRVNPPLILDLGPRHRAWLESIHDLFEPTRQVVTGDAKRRAAGWRCGMALQWATSSIEAGLGFMVRQAIRAGWRAGDSGLERAVSALRPYRGGPADEPASSLLARLEREVGRQLEDDDLDDLEELEEGDGWRPDRRLLAAILEEGVSLLELDRDAKWREIFDRILAPAGDEKVVLFAQPIETVSALARFLEQRTGAKPAIIVGAQSAQERQAAIKDFWKPSGPRYLVSSRAGGEGLNLQVARRLVHVDVPWNPMELEQRVGRVHRFLSRRTILVDTVVVKDSREVDVYRIARTKLQRISGTLVPEERFESLFSRVMSLVAPEELQSLMNERPLGPFSDDEQRRLSELVTQGFARWRDFHERFSEGRRQVHAVEAGAARFEDLQRFAEVHLKAKPIEGYSSLRFLVDDAPGSEPREASLPARVLDLDGTPHACGEFGGMPVLSEAGARIPQFGTNHALACEKLRALAFAEGPHGAACLGWPEGVPRPAGFEAGTFGLLVAVRQSVNIAAPGAPEVATALHLELVGPRSTARLLDPVEKRALVNALLKGTARRAPASEPGLVRALGEAAAVMEAELRRPSESDRESGVRHAVFPVLAALVD